MNFYNQMMFRGLISPKTGKSLGEKNRCLVTNDCKERFPIIDGVANLLSSASIDTFKKHEMKIFDDLDIHHISYFRLQLFTDVIKKIYTHYIKKKYTSRQKPFRVVEIGGGEGHWARNLKKVCNEAEVFINDLSLNTLKRAPKTLRRICADATMPLFEKGSIGLAAFWVSLHHFDKNEWGKVFKEVVRFLDDDGILIVFEPNDTFWPRKIMYRSKLGKDVYPDNKEQAINFSELSTTLKALGMIEIGTYFLNPPYSLKFLKKLKKWAVYFIVVEFFYQMDQWIFSPVFGNLFTGYNHSFKKYLSLYGLAFYKKGKVRSQ